MADEKIRKKRKKMYPLLAPQFLNERVIGETPLDEITLLKGKRVSTNLFNLMGDMKRQYIELSFQVSEIKENKGFTHITQFKLSNAFIKRMVRRGRSKIDDSFHVKDVKGNMVQIKPLIVTVGKAPNSVKTSLRMKMRGEVQKVMNRVDFEQFIKDLLDHKIQKTFKDTLTKLFPVKQVEIRLTALAPRARRETINAKIEPDQPKEEVDEHDEQLKEKIRKTQEKKETESDKKEATSKKEEAKSEKPVAKEKSVKEEKAPVKEAPAKPTKKQESKDSKE